MQISPQLDITLYLLEWLLWKITYKYQQRFIERSPLLYNAKDNVNWKSHHGNQYGMFLKETEKYYYHIIQQFHFWAYILRK